jgi:hypothetical protein
MENIDKKYLKDFSKQVYVKLKEYQAAKPFNFAPKIQIREVGSDGWAVQLGILRGYGCSVEIWFDRFTSHEKRKLYYGLYSRKPDGVEKIVQLSKSFLGKCIPVSLKDWAEDEEVVHLKRRLTRKDFGRPIFEKYSDEFLLGMYEYEKYGLQRNETKRLVIRVVEFVIAIIDSLQADQDKSSRVDYQALENRQRVQRHLRRERNGHLVTLRKQLDNFVCQVCGFDYANQYGALGEDFAEAHHIVPLAKDDEKRITTIQDLITVCANCHRMLHRMKGEAGDIQKLRKIIKKK